MQNQLRSCKTLKVWLSERPKKWFSHESCQMDQFVTVEMDNWGKHWDFQKCFLKNQFNDVKGFAVVTNYW